MQMVMLMDINGQNVDGIHSKRAFPANVELIRVYDGAARAPQEKCLTQAPDPLIRLVHRCGRAVLAFFQAMRLTIQNAKMTMALISMPRQ